MPRWTPCKRREFVRKLKGLGFEGPYSGARHQFLVHSPSEAAVPSTVSPERWPNLPRPDLPPIPDRNPGDAQRTSIGPGISSSVLHTADQVAVPSSP